MSDIIPIIPSTLTTTPPVKWRTTEVRAFLSENKVRYGLDDITIKTLEDVEGEDFIGFDADALKPFSLKAIQVSRILRLRNQLTAHTTPSKWPSCFNLRRFANCTSLLNFP